jgi:hypothetical protein
MKRFPFSWGVPCRYLIIRPERSPSRWVRAPPDYDNQRTQQPAPQR